MTVTKKRTPKTTKKTATKKTATKKTATKTDSVSSELAYKKAYANWLMSKIIDAPNVPEHLDRQPSVLKQIQNRVEAEVTSEKHSLCERLAILRDEKKEVDTKIKQVTHDLESMGGLFDPVILPDGRKCNRSVTNQYDINKMAVKRAMDEATFFKYCTITTTNIKKAVGEAEFDRLLKKKAISIKGETVSYRITK